MGIDLVMAYLTCCVPYWHPVPITSLICFFNSVKYILWKLGKNESSDTALWNCKLFAVAEKIFKLQKGA